MTTKGCVYVKMYICVCENVYMFLCFYEDWFTEGDVVVHSIDSGFAVLHILLVGNKFNFPPDTHTHTHIHTLLLVVVT